MSEVGESLGLSALQKSESGNPPGYDDLPASIRAIYSPKEYSWLNAQQKADLVRMETEQEWDEP
jgi:hypothetical protein